MYSGFYHVPPKQILIKRLVVHYTVTYYFTKCGKTWGWLAFLMRRVLFPFGETDTFRYFNTFTPPQFR